MELYAQNVNKADSLISRLHSVYLSEAERFEVLRKISAEHPNAVLALQYAYQALDLAEDMGEPLLQARAYEEIGLNERLLGNNVKSVAASLKALEIAGLNGAEELKAPIWAQLGANAINDGDYEQAIRYFKRVKGTYENENNVFHTALTDINLGEAYRLNQQLDSAVFCFKEAWSIGDSLNDRVVTSYALGNLGMVYNAQGRLEEAEKALEISLKLAQQLGDPYTHAVYLSELGVVAKKEQHWSQAETNLVDALHLAQANGLKEQVRDFSALLVSFYKQQKNYLQALTYQELFQVYQDSLVNKANVQKMEQVKANYQIDQRELEISHLNVVNAQEKQQKLLMLLILVVFVGLSVLLYRSNRQKVQVNGVLTHQKEMLAKREEEKALLLKELNHRVKNNLQMISSLLNLQSHELKGHPAEAAITAGRYRVDAMALIHQKLYREDVHTKIPLKEYIEELMHNLVYGFQSQVTLSLEIEEVDLSIDQAIPLALIINELVTNALKYAFVEITQPMLAVILHLENEYIVLKVRDNGVGFAEDGSGTSHSFGIKLVNSLIQQLKARAQLTNDQGVLWSIVLPKESTPLGKI